MFCMKFHLMICYVSVERFCCMRWTKLKKEGLMTPICHTIIFVPEKCLDDKKRPIPV
ncbi:hypothetical protein HanIR_Chr04g0179951 [Helianthus annuus]|nr:hypothetical protein HanIR_Chr04g0179951 [Helianthus annuus]